MVNQHVIKVIETAIYVVTVIIIITIKYQKYSFCLNKYYKSYDQHMPPLPFVSLLANLAVANIYK